MPVLALVCVLTFLHYSAAQMRAPLVPLYGAELGASGAWIGLIVGAHMAVAGVMSIPLGRMGDRYGRRRLMLAGIAISSVTSLLLPLAHDPVALLAIFAAAGLGVAAFTPSALALVGDAAPPGRAGQAFAWYTAVHYAAIAVGPFIGGLAADGLGYGRAFITSGLAIAMTLVIGLIVPMRTPPHAPPQEERALRRIVGNKSVWAGWIAAASGVFVQGVVFTFLPLLATERGLSASMIGFFFLVLGLANTVVRFPAGMLVDRSPRHHAYASAGVLIACIATLLFPHMHGETMLALLACIFGAASGFAFVPIGVALAGDGAPELGGIVMGGDSTSLSVGLALGSLAVGPVVDGYGFAAAFAAGGAIGGLGVLVAALLWRSAERGKIDPWKPLS